MNSQTLSRRSLLKAMAATSAAAVLAACAPAQSGSAPAAGGAAAPAAEQTTVRLLTTHGATMAPFIAASLEKFAAAHPEINISHEDLTEGYYDRLNVMLASNTLPDVVNLRSFDMYDWFRLGNLNSITPFLEADPDLGPEDMVDAIMQSCAFEGQHWGLPYDASVMIFFYNKTLLDAAGVAAPADGWTWDDMVSIAKSLTNPDDESWGFARFPGIANWTVEPWYLSNGAKMINEERTEWTLVGPEAEATLEFLVGLTKTEQVAPPPEAASDLNLFVIGKGAIYSSGQWEIPGNRDAIKDFEWDVVGYPAGPAGHHPITHGGTYVMYAKTQVPDAAWQIQKWICAGEDWQANVYGASGYSIPALKSVSESAWLAPVQNEGKPPTRAQVVLDELNVAVPGSLWPNYQKIASIMNEEMQNVLLGDATIPQGLEALKTRADEAIQEAINA
ncbi:MAG: sugar ABC transporter substrate-binding protein [Caldilineaceae bacterium]|nr:sugar ABC transporter substrate-binding protein [Caldilineaceae bacterium]